MPHYYWQCGILPQQWDKMPRWGPNFDIDFSWKIWICQPKIEQDVFPYFHACHKSLRKQAHHCLALVNLQFFLRGGILPHSTLLRNHIILWFSFDRKDQFHTDLGIIFLLVITVLSQRSLHCVSLRLVANHQIYVNYSSQRLKWIKNLCPDLSVIGRYFSKNLSLSF